jgi:hypothetical protein
MRRRIIIAVVSSAVAVAGFGLGGSTAYAACGLPDVCSGTTTLAATLTGTLGTRSVATVAPIAMTSVTNGTTLGTTWDTTVAEVTRSGTNPWSIQASLQNGHVTDLASDTIPASSFVLSGNTAHVVVGGGGTWAAGAGGALNDDGITGTPLCSNSGQVATNAYTGTYDCTGSITLTPPNGTPNGAYTGTFVVTLVQ